MNKHLQHTPAYNMQPGDRFVVVAAQKDCYGAHDYSNGSTGVVTRVYDNGVGSRGFYVTWDKPYHNDERDNERMPLVWVEEVEPYNGQA